MSADLETLHQYLQGIHPLLPNEWKAMAMHWKPFISKRKTILTAAGEVEHNLYFVLDGVQRAFYIGENGREATIVFTYPLSFSGVPDSLLTKQPSPYFFETLTASRFLRISNKYLFKLMEDYPNIQALILSALAFALHGVLKRQAEIQIFSNEEKFKALLKRSPHLLNLIPHKYIASYLGIDPTNFSKLLSTVNI